VRWWDHGWDDALYAFHNCAATATAAATFSAAPAAPAAAGRL
jgi:hypothetical protein